MNAPSWAGAAPFWGFALDFVPYVSYRFDYAVLCMTSNGRDKPDLTYNPLDYFWNERDAWTISATEGCAKAMSAADAVIARTVEHATTFFASVKSIEDLPAAFDAKRHRPPTRYGPAAEGAIHGQELLAYALTLARLGRSEEGREWLERFKNAERLMPHKTRRALDVIFAQTRCPDR